MTNQTHAWHFEVTMNADYPLQEYLLPTRAQRLAEVAGRKTNSLTVVLDGVHDPHNLSAVLRTCEGFGLLNLHVIETHGDFQISPKVTQGAEKWLDIHRYTDPKACMCKLKQNGYAVWVAQPNQNSRQVTDIPYKQRLALVFGNEHAGPSTDILGLSDGTFHIPMYGFSESFNVSVATGIALSQAVSARERSPKGHADLSSKEQCRLLSVWQHRSVKHADMILKRLGCIQPDRYFKPEV